MLAIAASAQSRAHLPHGYRIASHRIVIMTHFPSTSLPVSPRLSPSPSRVLLERCLLAALQELRFDILLFFSSPSAHLCFPLRRAAPRRLIAARFGSLSNRHILVPVPSRQLKKESVRREFNESNDSLGSPLQSVSPSALPPRPPF